MTAVGLEGDIVLQSKP